MIEKIILNHLGSELSVPVYTEVPEKKPESYVVIEKTGSSEENHIYSAMIAIQSYADSFILAADLNEQVKLAMKGAVELDEICNVQLNSDYNYTDTSMKKYRYQAVYDIVHY